jgi:glutathione S-transferase
MADFVLYHGNKNYSSWSMRGWLALRQTGADFEEVAFHLGSANVRRAIGAHSPSSLVPALQHGDLVVWDSLAITEYLAECFPDAGLWPVAPADRARARAAAAEMHSGFPALRRNMPFNVRRSSPGKGRGEGVAADIARVCAMWQECRNGAADGDFLFGPWSAADMFYAPVVLRFNTYAVELGPACRTYADAVADHPHVREWAQAATDEAWTEPEFDL